MDGAEQPRERDSRTAKALVEWLDKQPAVDTAKGIGNQGYCMGGPFTVRTAAAVPGRVKAAASFHGGGLVNPQNADDPTSPLKLIRADPGELPDRHRQERRRAAADRQGRPQGRRRRGRTVRPRSRSIRATTAGPCADSPVYNQAEAEPGLDPAGREPLPRAALRPGLPRASSVNGPRVGWVQRFGGDCWSRGFIYRERMGGIFEFCFLIAFAGPSWIILNVRILPVDKRRGRPEVMC